jgi:hypothetical protein
MTWAKVLSSLTYDEFKALAESTVFTGTQENLRSEIRRMWEERATLGKPTAGVEDNSQIMVDSYNAQSLRFARIRITKAS